MQLPLRRATLTEINQARRAVREYLRDKDGDVDFNDAAKLQVHLGILRRAELQEVLDIVDTEVHIIRLGSVAIATNPFELFLDYGNQIKARSLAEQTFLVQLPTARTAISHRKGGKGRPLQRLPFQRPDRSCRRRPLVRETLKNINEIFRD